VIGVVVSLTQAQIEQALARALPEVRLRSAAPSGDDALLRLSDGRALVLRRYVAPAVEPAALRLLALADIAAPQLVALVEDDAPLGQPYALLAPLEGLALAQALPQLREGERYEVGRQLGAAVARLHTVRAPRYGALLGEEGLPATNERTYTLGRLELAIGRLGNTLAATTATNLQHWFNEQFIDTGRPPALVHGAISPERILVRRKSEGWALAGLTGWGQAQGWSPPWDHAQFLEASTISEAFALRVGYGDGYEAATERAYEQIRERVLAPYRLIGRLERAAAEPAHAERHLRYVEAVLAGLLTPPGDDEGYEAALSA
jgi:hypothetical protein